MRSEVRARLARVKSPPVALAVLIAASTAARAVAATSVVTPWVNSDEITYSQLGQNLYANGHLWILAKPVGFLSLIYPAFAGLPLSLSNVGDAYELLKVLQAFVLSLTAVPVYLWSRRLASQGWSLVAAGLTLTLPGLAYAGLIMTEALFVPAMTIAAWAMAVAIARPSWKSQLVVLCTIALASLTRLQAIVLLPAFLTAVALKALVRGQPRRVVRQFAPTLTLAAVGALVWLANHLTGRSSVGALGGYRAIAEGSIDVDATARYVLYHAADVVMLSGVIPACAIVFLLFRVVATSDTDDDLVAYAVVAASLIAWLVLEVGTFAAKYAGHLAERNLLPLTPMIFVGFSAWLQRGAYRPRMSALPVATVVLVVLASVPTSSFVVHTLPDAFTLVPFARLQAAHPSFDVGVALVYAALPLLVMFAFTPRRLRWILPAAVAGCLAYTSVLVSDSVAEYSRTVAPHFFGTTKNWIDRGARAPAALIYDGEPDWNFVFENVFWNRDIRTVYALPGPVVPGPLPQVPVSVSTAGLLRTPTGSSPRERYLATAASVVVAGTPVEVAREARMTLWRATGRPRLRAWLQSMTVDAVKVGRRSMTASGRIETKAHLIVYHCGSAVVHLRLRATQSTTVAIAGPGARTTHLRLRAGAARSTGLQLGPTSRGQCTASIGTSRAPILVQPLEVAWTAP